MREIVLDRIVSVSIADRKMINIGIQGRREIYDKLDNEDLLDKFLELRELYDLMD